MSIRYISALCTHIYGSVGKGVAAYRAVGVEDRQVTGRPGVRSGASEVRLVVAASSGFRFT